MKREFAPLLEDLLAGQAMTEPEAHDLFDDVFDGQVSGPRLAAVLAALRTRPVRPDELVGFARVMRAHAVPFPRPDGLLLDNCGTGGAPHKAFNVSTTTAFLLAGLGIPVAKHGNRSFTRPTGSADVLAAAGGSLEMEHGQVARVLTEVGIAFLFAPAWHPAMKHAAPVRQELGVKTVFNLLGPLTNPAAPDVQVLGVYDRDLLAPMAEALARLGCVQGFVIWGEPGFDEATPCGAVHFAAIRDGNAADVATVDPADLGVARCAPADIAPVTREESAALMSDLLAGRIAGPRADTIALNAAFALTAVGHATDLQEGVEMARDALTQGIGNTKLQTFLAANQESG